MLGQLAQRIVAIPDGKHILFADVVPPEVHAARETKACANTGSSRRRWWDIFIEQCLNAAIVGGIAAFASGGDWRMSLKAFGITFLFELRKYRKL